MPTKPIYKPLWLFGTSKVKTKEVKDQERVMATDRLLVNTTEKLEYNRKKAFWLIHGLDVKLFSLFLVLSFK